MQTSTIRPVALLLSTTLIVTSALAISMSFDRSKPTCDQAENKPFVCLGDMTVRFQAKISQPGVLVSPSSMSRTDGIVIAIADGSESCGIGVVRPMALVFHYVKNSIASPSICTDTVLTKDVVHSFEVLAFQNGEFGYRVDDQRYFGTQQGERGLLKINLNDLPSIDQVNLPNGSLSKFSVTAGARYSEF